MTQVLLIEPDIQLADIYEKALRQEGYNVLQCREAGEAIAMLDSFPIELVVIEIQIALHNGIEFLYEMRSYPDWQNLPVIIHSFVPKRIIEQNGKIIEQLNISEVMYKPVTKLHELITAVNRTLYTPVSP